MQLTFDESFLDPQLREQAASRGDLPRFLATFSAREDDGLERLDALLDAGEATGLVSDLSALFEAALEPLPELLDTVPDHLHVTGGKASMPTLRVDDDRLVLELPPSSLEDLGVLVARLVARLAEDPERTAVTVPAGLGGTGGCSTGDCLPEDAAPGPLFER